MATRHFFIDGQYMGAEDAPLYHIFAELRSPSSSIYVCPVCGDVWAKLVVEGSRFWAENKVCRKHTPEFWYTVYGSIWSEFDRHITDHLPPDVLRREFELHLEHGLRFYKEDK